VCSSDLLLAKEADFFSIGTNDLTQYTLAVDRQNESISEFCNTHHEAIIRMIRMTAQNATKAGIWCGICGMLGADFGLTQTFLEMGISELSVEPSFILKLRAHIAKF
jgi:phosphotransferase system enzyme I (PtsI)